MSDEVQPLFYNGHRVEFTDPEDPRAEALANGEDPGVDPDEDAPKPRAARRSAKAADAS